MFCLVFQNATSGMNLEILETKIPEILTHEQARSSKSRNWRSAAQEILDMEFLLDCVPCFCFCVRVFFLFHVLSSFVM